MLIKHIRHFLTPAGMDYFPAWVSQLQAHIQAVEGFSHLHYGISEQNPNQRQLLLYFSNQSGLSHWIKNPVHEQLLQDIEQYSTCDWQMETYLVK